MIITFVWSWRQAHPAKPGLKAKLQPGLPEGSQRNSLLAQELILDMAKMRIRWLKDLYSNIYMLLFSPEWQTHLNQTVCEYWLNLRVVGKEILLVPEGLNVQNQSQKNWILICICIWWLPVAEVWWEECHVVVMELLVNIGVREDCSTSDPHLGKL